MKLENRLLDLVAGISPWLAPLIPTYFAAYNAYLYLAKGKNWWDVGAVVIVALVVELIGLAGVHTAIQFWNWNRIRKKSEDAAPLGMAVIAVVVYVVIIISVNALLDFFAVADPERLPYVKIVAVALLSLLALNSALIVALRAGQIERESKADEAKQERKQERKEKQERGNFPVTFRTDENLTGNFPADWRKARPFMSDAEVAEIARMSGPAIAKKYHLPTDGKTGRNWRGYAIEEVKAKAQAEP
jgi:hypothetical protein